MTTQLTHSDIACAHNNIMVRIELCLGATHYYTSDFRRNELLVARDKLDYWYDQALTAIEHDYLWPAAEVIVRHALTEALNIESLYFELPEAAVPLGLEVMS